MKKEYIKPTLKADLSLTSQLLANSVEVKVDDYDDGTILGRDSDFDWDED